MFGEVPIYGNCEKNLDSKNRLTIPKFSSVEENDRLVIQKSDTGNFYIIINCSKIDEEIAKLKEKDEKRKIELLTSSIVALTKVDKQGRIIFHPNESFAIDRKVFIHGNYDCIHVFSSKKDYEDHIDELKKNR